MQESKTLKDPGHSSKMTPPCKWPMAYTKQWKWDFLTTRARHSCQDVLVITLLLEVIVINIIIMVRVFLIPVSNVITRLISTINAAAKTTAFTADLSRLRSISLAQPGLTGWGTASAAGCSHVITGTHSPLKKPSFYLASLSQRLKYVGLISK